MRKKAKQQSLEKTVEELLKKAGSKGMLQQELWKKLGLDSREGTKLVLKLVRKGLIKREPVTVNGRRTYKLFAVTASRSFEIPVSLETVMEIPCFTCKHLGECGGGGRWDPSTCPVLENWLQEKARERRSKSSL